MNSSTLTLTCIQLRIRADGVADNGNMRSYVVQLPLSIKEIRFWLHSDFLGSFSACLFVHIEVRMTAS